ncbi:MAG: hypothetical protein U1F45_17190 [Burkholderiales bacterium]
MRTVPASRRRTPTAHARQTAQNRGGGDNALRGAGNAAQTRQQVDRGNASRQVAQQHARRQASTITGAVAPGQAEAASAAARPAAGGVLRPGMPAAGVARETPIRSRAMTTFLDIRQGRAIALAAITVLALGAPAWRSRCSSADAAADALIEGSRAATATR